VSALLEFRGLGVAFLRYSENIDTGSALGEAVFSILAAVSQLERDIIRERVKAGLVAAKARGKRLGRPKRRDDAAIWRLADAGQGVRAISRQLKVSFSSVQASLASRPARGAA
jgi:DNA invertase Pin-like site-specific DNA recombinase